MQFRVYLRGHRFLDARPVAAYPTSVWWSISIEPIELLGHGQVGSSWPADEPIATADSFETCLGAGPHRLEVQMGVRVQLPSSPDPGAFACDFLSDPSYGFEIELLPV